MLNLIPMPKTVKINSGFLKKKTVILPEIADDRVKKAAEKLPSDRDGAALSFKIGAAGEGYELEIAENSIAVTAD